MASNGRRLCFGAPTAPVAACLHRPRARRGATDGAGKVPDRGWRSLFLVPIGRRCPRVMTEQTDPTASAFEPPWPSAVAVVGAIALYVSLPDSVISGSHSTGLIRFIVPALELAVLIPLAVAAPHRHVYESGKRRTAAITLTAVVSLANIASLGFLIHELLYTGTALHRRQLLVVAAQIWSTNVIVFGLWYWELDGGGPPKRFADLPAPRDFAFPQMTDPRSRPQAGTHASSTSCMSPTPTPAPSAPLTRCP